MKKILIFLLILAPAFTFAQLGIKAGLNFANVTNASSINAGTRTGYHLGIFFAGSSKSILSSRTEMLYSRQGYNFSTNENTGTVDLSYLMLPQFLAINITKLVQIQAGAQISYLLNAKVDSTNNTGNPSADKVLDLFNRIDYGFAGGIEVHPVKMIVAGARLNISLGKLYKEPEPGEQYNFIPDINIRNNLFQLYAGLKFGGD